MSDYPGNPFLPSAVREKVTSTFQQSVDLYRQGRTDEVQSGCKLILQMDPQFDPAKKLLEKAQNPAAPIDVESLWTGSADGAAGSSMSEARAAMAARDFERVIQLTSEILTNDLMNDEARVLADEAREKVEAAPFIEQFVRKCEQNLSNNNVAAARMDLEKARALDPLHPGVSRIEELIAAKEKSAGSASSSSFVVETPAPTARSTAQASDFGFTFEEEKGAEKQPPEAGGGLSSFSFDSPSSSGPEAPFGGGFSFDTPVANAAASAAPMFDSTAPAASNEFDFSTASVESSPDDQKKIEQYLSDGDQAFQAGNHQQAIDLWSRVFLIDVTNDAASERIERAKNKRRETEQQIETILSEAVQAFERRDTDTASAKFSEVLRLDPNNVAAQDYLERLQSAPAAPDHAPSFSSQNSGFDEVDVQAQPAIPKRRENKPAAGPRPPTPAATARRKPNSLILGLVVLAVLGGGGYFAWSRFMAAPKADPAAARALLDHATQLASAGKYDQAITTLQEIKPGDAPYDKALVMIADLQQKKARASASVDGRPAGSYYEENLAAGRTAFQAHDYVLAKKSFEQALRVKPLPADARASYDIAAQQVGKLETARNLFVESKYEDVITSLQPLLQQDPSNKNIQRMIVDSHFNLGARALQEERLADASREFDEVLKADPRDELALRSKDLAGRYDGQPKDLLFKIYVKYLPMRQAPAA